MIDAQTKAKQRTYQTWQGMKQRCLNPKCANYPNYGGRGIIICDRWLESFDAFAEDMGMRPEGMTIDRIDVNGDYEPSNCRWADRATQRRNQRDVLIIEYRGVSMSAEEWGRKVGIDPQTIRDRYQSGLRGDELLDPIPLRSREKIERETNPSNISSEDELRLLQQQLSYDPCDGEIRWKVQRSRSKPGDIAGSRDKTNGKKLRCRDKFYAFHRVAWALHYGSWPDGHVSHRNGDKMDNRISNLFVRAAKGE
jgi:hypothetical protein